jgi:hypothetical protein
VDAARLVEARADHARDIRVPADEMVREIRARRPVGGDAAGERRNGKPALVERVRGPGLPVVLLHVAGLAVALEGRIELAIAGRSA